MAYVKKTVVAELEKAYLDELIDLSKLDAHERSGYSLTMEVFIYAFAQLPRRDMTLHEVLTSTPFEDIPMESHNNRVYVEAIYKVWVDFDSLVVNREDNILDPLGEDANPSWKVGYTKALVNYVLTQGHIVALNADTFMWEDFLFDKSTLGTPVAVFNMVEDDDWIEFVDTMSGNETFYGITADVMFDSGISRRLRVRGDFGEIVRSITA